MPVCAGCGASASENLCCPICAKGGYAAFFCTQQCFEKNWKQHSKLHQRVALGGKSGRAGDAAAGKGKRGSPQNGGLLSSMVMGLQDSLGAPGGKGKPPSSMLSLCLIYFLTCASQRRFLVVLIVGILLLIFYVTNSTSDQLVYQHQPMPDISVPETASAGSSVPGAVEAQLREMQKQMDAQGGALKKLVAKLEEGGVVSAGDIEIKTPSIVDDFDMGSDFGGKRPNKKYLNKAEKPDADDVQPASDLTSSGSPKGSASPKGSSSIGSVKAESPKGKGGLGGLPKPPAAGAAGDVRAETTDGSSGDSVVSAAGSTEAPAGYSPEN